MDELRGIPNDLVFPPGGTIPPAPSEPPIQNSYQMQPDPMYAQSSMGQPDLPPASPAQSDEGGWQFDPAMFSRIGQTIEGVGAGLTGSTPLFLQMNAQRQQAAQHQATLMEQKRQHDMGLFEKVLSGSPEAMGEKLKMLGADTSFQFAKQANQMARVFKERDFAAIQAGQHLLPDDVHQAFLDGKMNDQDLAAWGGFIKKSMETNAVKGVERRILGTALAKPADKRDDYENGLVEDYQAKLLVDKDKHELAQSTIAKNNAVAKKEDNPKVTQMAEEISQELFDQPWEKLNQGQRTAVQATKEQRLKGRTSAMITNTQLPESTKNQADMYMQSGLDNLELIPAPKGLTPEQYRTGPYRQLDEKEKDAITQYKVAEKTVSTMNRVADALITANSPGAAIKQKLKLEAGAIAGTNGLAAAYKADKASFSSRMARLVEVGVLTNTDVTRWENTFGDFGDTKQNLKAKQALFGEIQDETSKLLKMKLGGKLVTTTERSRLDKLLEKADHYSPISKDLQTLGILQ